MSWLTGEVEESCTQTEESTELRKGWLSHHSGSRVFSLCTDKTALCAALLITWSVRHNRDVVGQFQQIVQTGLADSGATADHPHQSARQIAGFHGLVTMRQTDRVDRYAMPSEHRRVDDAVQQSTELGVCTYWPHAFGCHTVLETDGTSPKNKR